MIRTTEKLIESFNSDRRLDATMIAAHCRVIANYGDRTDAAALLRLYMEQPEDYRYVMLLDPVMRCGDLELAAQLHQFSFEQNRLKEKMPSDVLHVLGYMGYELSTDYLVDCITSGDWYVSKDACLALLHLSCEDQHERLSRKLEDVYGHSLFPEMLPALCVKWASADEIIPRLLTWGEQASSDCNGGLVIGIAMYGSTQKEQIRRMIWDPNWEMCNSGTGSHWWAYMSMQMVGLTFSELITALKLKFPITESADAIAEGLSSENDVTSSVSVEHSFQVLHDLLQLKLDSVPHPLRYAPENKESMMDLYQQLFSWSTENVDDSIPGVINHVFGIDSTLLEQYSQLRSKMELYVSCEIERNAIRRR